MNTNTTTNNNEEKNQVITAKPNACTASFTNRFVVSEVILMLNLSRNTNNKEMLLSNYIDLFVKAES